MAKTTQEIREALVAKYDYQLFDDFDWFITVHRWTSLAADAGSSVAHSDTRGGVVVLTTGATDNNECTVRTSSEPFLPTADRPMYGAGYLATADVNTDDGNVFFGFCSALAADTITDNGGDVRTTGMIFGIYKLDGGTVWRCNTRNGSTETDSISTQASPVSATTYQLLEIIVEEFSTTQCVATFKVDGAYLRDATTLQVIEHKVLYASGTEMNFGVYAKTGDATPGSLVVNVDWLAAGQVR